MSPVRDHRSWMREIERRSSGDRSIQAVVADAADAIRDETEIVNTRTPAAPVELEYQTALYLDTSGRQRVRFLLDFPDVTKATDGTDLAIQKYELWGQDTSSDLLPLAVIAAAAVPAHPGLAWPGLAIPGYTLIRAAAVPDPDDAIAWACAPNQDALDLDVEAPASEPTTPTVPVDPPDTTVPLPPPPPPTSTLKPMTLLASNPGSSFRAENFLPNSRWVFRVRAIGANTITPGEWSEAITVQMLRDTVAPAQPTAPTLRVDRGTITVSWDGKSVLGQMPADFRYAVLAGGDTSSPTKEIARFGRVGGFTVVADLEYYDPQFFRLQAVDESGNKSPWGEQAVSYVTPLVDRDIILSTIDAAKTHLKNIDAGVSILEDTILLKHLVVTEEMTAALANFLHVKVDMLEANEIWADEAFFGLADARLVRSDMFEGKEFVGGTFTVRNGGMIRTDVEDYTGIKITSTGMEAWNSSNGVRTFDLDANTGDLTIFGGTFTGAAFQTDAGAAVGIKIDDVGLRAYGAGTRTFEIDRASGAVVGTGQFRTGKDGNFIEMDATAQGGVLRFWTGGDGVGQGRGTIWARDDATDGEKLSIAYSTLDEPAGNMLPVIVAMPDKVYLRYGSRSIEVGNVNGAEQLTINAEGAAVVVYGNLDMRSGLTTYRYGAATELAYVGQRVGAGGSPDFEIRALEGGIRLVGLLQSVATYGATTTTPANVVVTAAGDLQRSSSASRYKLDQRALDVPDAVLEIGMKDWVDKGEFERAQGFLHGRPVDADGALAFDALNLGRIPGLIAEDLVAKGLEQYVIYGPDGDTEGVMYDRFALAQIAALVRRVKKLEAAATNSV